MHHPPHGSSSPTSRIGRRSTAVRIAIGVLSLSTAATAQELVEDGAASWYASVPQGRGVPCDNNGVPVEPNVTADFEGHASTADWCSSIFWERYPGNPYGNPMFPLPLAMQASPDGLLLGRPPEATNTAFAFATPFGYNNAPMRITTGGLSGGQFAVAAVGDWTVTPRWSDDGRTLEATFGHGMPFVYARSNGGRPVIDPRTSLGFELIEIAGREACFRIAGDVYAAYASPERTWQYANGVLITDQLVPNDTFAVACLPDATAETRAMFLAAADARVIDSRASWSYDAANSEVVAEFEFILEPNTRATPIVALFRHQWLHAEIEPESYLPTDLATSRGEMKLVPTASFTVRHPFNGLLPNLPDLGQSDPTRLAQEMAGVMTAPDLIGGDDTYWNGKSLGRAAMLLPIAEQLGDEPAADRLLAEMKAELEDWFDVSSANDDRFLAYQSTWGSVFGYPDAYGSTYQLNDHHFHYGYLIRAAASIAERDRAWAADWGGAVELLIRDAANWDRSDDRFPFLRNFDPYAGHAHASGHGAFGNGNNQESSSESINFAAAVALWGATVGNDEIRDLGIYLHAVESEAIAQYWFDADDAVFPENYPHPLVGIVWSNGGDYATWWTNNPEEIHGINLLPITTGSLHLGRWPNVMRRNHLYMVQRNGGTPTLWQDVLWSGWALGDPTGAMTEFETRSYAPEPGESRPHTRQWISSLAAWGRVDPTVTADTPHYAVFEKDGVRTRIAWNPGTERVTVTFSDGVSGCVPSGALMKIDVDSIDCEPADVPGDLDGDGTVGGSDLGLLIASWGVCGTPDCPGDLNGDGRVDGADLGLLFGHWTV